MLRAFVGVVALLAACELPEVSNPADDLSRAEGDGEAPLPPPPPPGRLTDSFTQTLEPVVDVLFVVHPADLAELDTVVADSPHFAAWLVESGVDYHVGVTSADTAAEGGVVTWSAPGEPLLENLTDGFVEAEGAECSALDATVAALEGLAGSDNAGFLREDSAVHVVVVGSPISTHDLLKVDEFAAWFGDLRDQRTTTFSLLGAPPPPAYASVTAQVGGGIHDFTASTPSDGLGEVGRLASGMEVSFFLSERPTPASLEVVVTLPDPESGTLVFERAQVGSDGVLLREGDYVYDAVANAVRFLEYVPEVGSRIDVHYDRLP